MQLDGPVPDSTGGRPPKPEKDRSKGCSRCHFSKNGCPPSCRPEFKKAKAAAAKAAAEAAKAAVAAAAMETTTTTPETTPAPAPVPTPAPAPAPPRRTVPDQYERFEDVPPGADREAIVRRFKAHVITENAKAPLGMVRDWESYAPAHVQMEVRDRLAREVWRERYGGRGSGGGGSGSGGGGSGGPGDNDDDDDDDPPNGGGGGGGGGDYGGGDGGGGGWDGGNVSRADASALMVLCDRDYVVPVKWEDLTAQEQKRSRIWFNTETRRQRGKTPSPEEVDRMWAEIYEKVQNFNLIGPLPNYKCCARPFTGKEHKMLSKQRAEIDKAMGELSGSRADANRGALFQARQDKGQTDPSAPDYTTDRQLASMNNDDLGAFMYPYVIGVNELTGVRDELCTRIARLALTPEPIVEDEIKKLVRNRGPAAKDKMLASYYDFMNEERRLILRTIRGANDKKVENTANTESWNVVPATKKELDAFLEADALEDYTAYFEGKREVERSNVTAPFQPLTADMWRSCEGVAPTSFDDAVDVANIYGGTDKKREKAEKWCRKLEVKDDYNTRETQLESLGGDRARPSKRWIFPYDKDEKKPLEGFWAAARRMREVKNELGMGSTLGGWRYARAYDADPLIKTSQKGVILVPKPGGYSGPPVIGLNDKPRAKIVSDVSLMIQLFRKHGGEEKAQGKSGYSNRLLEIELLRCYPLSKRGTDGINSILEFVCWWHKTITTNDDAINNLYERLNPGKVITPTERENEKRRAVYDLLCCPDCMTNSGTLLKGADRQQVPSWVGSLRSLMHTQVAMLAVFVPMLKEALDTDVFKTPKEESVLWRGGCLWYDAKAKVDKLNEPHAQLLDLKRQHAAMQDRAAQKKAAAIAAREEMNDILGYAQERNLEYERAKAEAEVLDSRLDGAGDVNDEQWEEMKAVAEEAERHWIDLQSELNELRDRIDAKEREASKLEAEASDLDTSANQIDDEVRQLEQAIPPDEQTARETAQADLNKTAFPSPDDRKRGQAVYRQWQAMNPLVS